MNFSWLSLIGGGFAAAATLTAGISMSGLFSPASPSNTSATDASAAETIYVEQPVIEVPSIVSPVTLTPLPPLVIAILPAAPGTDASSSSGIPSTGGETPVPTPTPGSDTPAPTPPPSFSDIGDDDDESGEVEEIGEDESGGEGWGDDD